VMHGQTGYFGLTALLFFPALFLSDGCVMHSTIWTPASH
jgi:hypothetical protein